LFVCLFVFLFFLFRVVLFCRSLKTPHKMAIFVFVFFFFALFPPTHQTVSDSMVFNNACIYMYVCLQAFVDPPLTSHIFKAFWQTIKLIIPKLDQKIRSRQVASLKLRFFFASRGGSEQASKQVNDEIPAAVSGG
jgi:hypothetical protein